MSQRDVYNYLLEHGPSTGPVMAEALGMNKNKVYTAIQRMRKHNELVTLRETMPSPSGGRIPAVYGIRGVHG